ncbi:MAG TPA: hypothetical protein VGL61_06380 [Kofleriaceae bacterium]|jgi:hypothetical protein
MPKVIPFDALCALLGKQPDDPAVTAVLANAGKVTKKPDFIVAKDAGFDFSLARPRGANKKVLSTLFLFGEGREKHRAYAGLPAPWQFLPRDELRAKTPPPIASWKLGAGKVPPGAPGASHDRWLVNGVELAAMYVKSGELGHYNVSRPEDLDRDITVSPLHFATRPVDAPAGAEHVGAALLAAWGVTRFGVPAKHAGNALAAKLAKRAVSPREFLEGACGKRLAVGDFAPELENFLWGYAHRHFTAPRKTDKAIAKLLRLHRADERSYNDDFLGTFADLASPFYVPDSWAAVDRIAPVLDARWADFQATALERAPDLAIYETAAKLRDGVAIEPARGAVAAVTADAIADATADDALALDLVRLVDKPLADKAVQAVLARAKLPVGKKIDEQANPALGVSYLGVKLSIGGKRVMGVKHVTFYAPKQKSYIRGLGCEVEFRGFPGTLPGAIEMGAARAAVAKAFGPPKQATKDEDYWFPAADRRITATYNRAGKLVQINFGKPAEWGEPPKPPYSPTGIL